MNKWDRDEVPEWYDEDDDPAWLDSPWLNWGLSGLAVAGVLYVVVRMMQGMVAL